MAGKLTSIAEEAARSRSLNGAFHGRALLKLCSQLENIDRANEKRRRRANVVTIVAFIVMILALVSLFMLIGALSLPELSPLLGFVLLCLIAVVRGRRIYREAGFVDLTNELHRTISGVLRKVLADLDPKAKIRVNLNLGTINAERPDSTSTPSARPGQHLKNINVFNENLGALWLPLANGNTIVLRLRNQYRQSVRSYRSSSGKSKRKEKWKKISKVTAILIPNTPTPAWVERTMKSFVNPAKETLRFKDRNGITTARLDRRFKYQKAGEQPTDVVPAAEVVSMLVRLSAMAHQGIQGAKSAK